MKELQVRNNQRDQRIDAPFLRMVTRTFLDEVLKIEAYELGIHLVSPARMARLNEQFLQHAGPTDVITFDLNEGPHGLVGEIYVCVAVAEKQAVQFRTHWTAEVIRYVVHGVLHLLGYDDLTPAGRKVMKRQENRLMSKIQSKFDLNLVRA